MPLSSIFRSNKSQAVRIPKAMELPDHVKRVEIIKQGAARLVIPAGGGWEAFFNGPRLDEDFLADRAQAQPQQRKAV